MRYFYDCEFLEGPQTRIVLGIPFGKSLNTIDLISIGIVAEDGRELYLISKDFNLKEAWNRYQMKQVHGDARNVWPEGVKEYWIRENVLKPIFLHFIKRELAGSYKMEQVVGYGYSVDAAFTFRNLKKLLKKYGKSRKELAEEIHDFCSNNFHKGNLLSYSHRIKEALPNNFKPQFYGYYSAYDHVCLCWIFGKMINLPKGFPMYTIDLKQILDDKVKSHLDKWNFSQDQYLSDGIKKLKETKGYPTQDNCHDALDDAKWNKNLYEFLIGIQ